MMPSEVHPPACILPYNEESGQEEEDDFPLQEDNKSHYNHEEEDCNPQEEEEKVFANRLEARLAHDRAAICHRSCPNPADRPWLSESQFTIQISHSKNESWVHNKRDRCSRLHHAAGITCDPYIRHGVDAVTLPRGSRSLMPVNSRRDTCR
jgi:hypothetical protein